ncbi:MAG: TIGR02266 family protein [Myxococcota bacterium]
MIENRRHKRVLSRLRCWCEGQNVTLFVRIGDLSEGGLFLRTSTPLERGTKALLRFQVGEAAEVETRATVMWARGDGEEQPPGMGLQFEELAPGTRELIRRLVEGSEKRP